MLQRNNQFWDYFLRRYEKVRETKIIVRLFIVPILPLKMCQFDSDRFSLGDETLVKRKYQKYFLSGRELSKSFVMRKKHN